MNILFVGAGRMARAIAGGMVKNGFDVSRMCAFDVSEAAAREFTAATGIAASCSNVAAALKSADAVMLAVKPQTLSDAVSGLDFSGKLVISIVAGAPLGKLSGLCGGARLIRVMPNTPALIGMGCSAYAPGPGIEAADLEFTQKLLESVGKAFALDEKLMDAVTALSGSGPAYVFDFISALADGGVACGLPRDIALELAAGTVAGSAELLRRSGKLPAELRDQVTSPGGTTIRALEVLEDRAFRGAVIAAVKAAAARSAELGRNA